MYKVGDKGKGICFQCGPTSTKFEIRNVPFSDGSGIAQDILVGVCDSCNQTIAIPAQSSESIKFQHDNLK